eukprot:1159827-Pelagomonas_calceolata.AAC.4
MAYGAGNVRHTVIVSCAMRDTHTQKKEWCTHGSPMSTEARCGGHRTIQPGLQEHDRRSPLLPRTPGLQVHNRRSPPLPRTPGLQEHNRRSSKHAGDFYGMVKKQQGSQSGTTLAALAALLGDRHAGSEQWGIVEVRHASSKPCAIEQAGGVLGNRFCCSGYLVGRHFDRIVMISPPTCPLKTQGLCCFAHSTATTKEVGNTAALDASTSLHDLLH